MYKYVIIESQHGYMVYVDLITSSAGRYFSRTPYTIHLVEEVLLPMNLDTSEQLIERDMGRIVGKTDIVETSEKDIIFYAKALKKNAFSRYAKNRYPSPSSKLSIVLKRDSDGNYEIVDTWIGPLSPPFPGDDKETTNSKSYWQTHALVQDAQVVQTKTVTKDCPY